MRSHRIAKALQALLADKGHVAEHDQQLPRSGASRVRGGQGQRVAHAALGRAVHDHVCQMIGGGQKLRWLWPGHIQDRSAELLRRAQRPQAQRLTAQHCIQLAAPEPRRAPRAKDRDQWGAVVHVGAG